MGIQPLLNLSLSQAQDVLGGVQRGLATANMQEVQALGSLVQILFVAVRITKGAEGVGLDQSSGLSIILALADDLLHKFNLLSLKTRIIIHIFIRKSRGSRGCIQ